MAEVHHSFIPMKFSNTRSDSTRASYSLTLSIDKLMSLFSSLDESNIPCSFYQVSSMGPLAELVCFMPVDRRRDIEQEAAKILIGERSPALGTVGRQGGERREKKH